MKITHFYRSIGSLNEILKEFLPVSGYTVSLAGMVTEKVIFRGRNFVS